VAQIAKLLRSPRQCVW